jgi:lycopene cyclase domain-containing protein
MVWDVYAVAQHHWWFDSAQVTGAIAVAAVPVEELAFFLVIPVCAVLTFEAVRSRWGWMAGDERVEES